MRKSVRILSVLMALALLVTSFPMFSLAADEPTGASTFDLVVDGLYDSSQSGADANDVTYPDDMVTIPTGKGIYSDADCTTPKGLTLDWDQFFNDDKASVNRDIGYTLWRTVGEFVASGNDLVAEYGDSWSKLSVWDGEKVNVLVVYPQVWDEENKSFDNTAAQNIMSSWLNSDLSDGSGKAGKDLFNIDTVMLADATNKDNPNTFNFDAEKWLYGTDDDGNKYYKYDVILFGTWDANGGDKHANNGAENAYGYAGTATDLTEDAAKAVQAFIDSGRGVLFGHDTVCSATNIIRTNFNKYFADDLGIVLMSSEAGSGTTAETSEQNIRGMEVTNKAEVVNQGLLTTYPWTLTGMLDIPATHTLYQVVEGDSAAKIWMKLRDTDDVIVYDDNSKVNPDADDIYFADLSPLSRFEKEDTSDYYLITKDNVAMIQTGHSSGRASDDERKVFANTLFYLKQKSLSSYAIDGDFIDNTDPVVENEAVVSWDKDSLNPDDQTFDGNGNQTFSATVSFDGKDIGTPYKYRVDAEETGVDTVSSNEAEAAATSELKGYIITVDQTETPDADAIVAAKTNGRVVNVDKTASAGTYTYTATNLITNVKNYVHIIPVDNANNVGEMVTLCINLDDLYDSEVSTVIQTIDPKDPDDPTDDVKKNVYDTRTYDEETDSFKTDTEVVIDITTTVDTLEREVIGTLVIVDQNNNVVKKIENIEATPEYGYPLEEELKISIDEIYTEEDYLEDGKFTATITWNDKYTGEKVAEKKCEFIIKRPEYKVSFVYSEFDLNGNVDECTVTGIIKHGDSAESLMPEIKAQNYSGGYVYIYNGWIKSYGGNSTDEIVADTEFVAAYTKVKAPTKEEEETPQEPEKEVELIRLGGEDRIDTALEISRHGWTEADVVVLATANQFPDAMAGVPLATAVDAPILLTINGEYLEKEVLAEIARLSPEKVYILGQTDAVNANIEAQLDALYEIERLGGKDRFGTAVAIAVEMEEINNGKPTEMFFVRSDLYADALSVSSVAAIKQYPILYVAPNGNLDKLTSDYAKSIANAATIVGGTEAVSETAEKNIDDVVGLVDRIFGDDRYETSVKVCTTYNDLFTGDGTALATGKKFPDALTGGAFAAKNKIPVLLVNGSVSTELAQYLGSRPITKLYVFGEVLAVSDELAYEALSYCVYPTEA